MDAQVFTKPVDKSQIKKRETKNSSLNTVGYKYLDDSIDSHENASLTHRSSNEQEGNTIVVPFVQMGKAELRVRIEKIITNETSSIKPDNSVNYTAEISSYSTMVPNWETINGITETSITNLEATTNFDSTKQKKGCNLTMKIVFKKLNVRSDSNQKTSNSENALFYNTESYPIESNSKISVNQTSENENYDHAHKMSVKSSNKNAKSRAKRHQEVASKHSSHSDDTNTIEDSKHIEQKTSVVDRKQKATKYKRTRGDHVVKSIEEIKALAKNLIVKVRNYYLTKNRSLNRLIFAEQPFLSLFVFSLTHLYIIFR